MESALALVGLIVLWVASFAFRSAIDRDITIRRRAPSVFGWMTMWPVLGLIAWLYVRRRYPVVTTQLPTK